MTRRIRSPFYGTAVALGEDDYSRRTIQEEQVLRISPVRATDGQSRFKVEGRLAGEFVGELLRVTSEALERSRVSLDLADVTFADHGGARLLKTLEGAGVELVDPSEFVLALMKGEEP